MALCQGLRDQREKWESALRCETRNENVENVVVNGAEPIFEYGHHFCDWHTEELNLLVRGKQVFECGAECSAIA